MKVLASVVLILFAVVLISVTISTAVFCLSQITTSQMSEWLANTLGIGTKLLALTMIVGEVVATVGGLLFVWESQ